MNTEIQLKCWHKLGNGKIVYLDSVTTIYGKTEYVATAIFSDNQITFLPYFMQFYNKEEIIIEVDIIEEMRKYNAVLKSFGLEIVKTA